MFPPAELFNQEILDLPPGNMKLCKFLEGHGVTLSQHSARSIIQALVRGLYSGSENCESVIQTASLIISHGRRARMDLSCTSSELSYSQPQTAESSAIQTKRIAHNVAMRLKDLDSKFDSDLEEC